MDDHDAHSFHCLLGWFGSQPAVQFLDPLTGNDIGRDRDRRMQRDIP
jgi:hypothetical protein